MSDGRFTVGPPGDTGADYQANTMEWLACTMEKGDPCWFRKKGGEWMQGTLQLVWNYDGIIADVASDGRRYGLLLSMGDELSRTDPRLHPWWR